MKKIIQVQIAPWDRIISLECEEDINIFDKVIIKTDFGLDVATVIDIVDEKRLIEENIIIEENFSFLRKASKNDLEKNFFTQEDKDRVLMFCNNLIEKKNLSMKLVDALFSFDKSHITFVFLSEGRIDFRSLVKDLTKHFNCVIRMQQIGPRDYTKITSDQGICGRKACCSSFIKKFFPITGEMADVQGLSVRGCERLSGLCGKLKCCLSYETQGYKEKSDRMPPIGNKVNVDGRVGVVCGHHLLKESVDVKFKDKDGGEVVVEVDLNRNKKK